MFEICKDFTFSAAHHLVGLPDDHPCARVHGHNYVVRVRLQASRTDHLGFVLDYRDLDPFRRYLDDALDHRDLNDVMLQPTAENLSRFLHSVLAAHVNIPADTVWSVSVSETPKTWATWTP